MTKIKEKNSIGSFGRGTHGIGLRSDWGLNYPTTKSGAPDMRFKINKGYPMFTTASRRIAIQNLTDAMPETGSNIIYRIIKRKKVLPHPQLPASLGLIKVKDCHIKSSFQSICVPKI